MRDDEVVEFSAETGRPLRAVTPAMDESGMGGWCGALWSDPSGRHALAVCRREGRIDDGRFTVANLHFPVPNQAGDGFDFFAW